MVSHSSDPAAAGFRDLAKKWFAITDLSDTTSEAVIMLKISFIIQAAFVDPNDPSTIYVTQPVPASPPPAPPGEFVGGGAVYGVVLSPALLYKPDGAEVFAATKT